MVIGIENATRLKIYQKIGDTGRRILVARQYFVKNDAIIISTIPFNFCKLQVLMQEDIESEEA